MHSPHAHSPVKLTPAERLWRGFILGLAGLPILIVYLPSIFAITLFPLISRTEVIYFGTISILSFVSFALALVALRRRWPMTVSLLFSLVPSVLWIVSLVAGPFPN